ncbi:MAG: dephospho-CoA kinase [Candidatus Phytoplasma sp.]|nr:dephospho-CoA kinase [Phytoplasma sp.]
MCAKIVKNKLIGLTGSIATGKTTVANYLIKKGYKVIDSDQIVAQLLTTPKVIKELEKFNVLDDKNTVDKQKMAKLLFSDEKIRHEINQIIHPKVFEEIERQIKKVNNKQPIFIDMPLLIETGYYQKVDEILLIYTTIKTQTERLMKRNHLTKAEAKRRISTQISINEKKKYATHIINNNKGLEELYDQIDQYLKSVV